MTALWNVALEAEDLNVVQQATRLLNRAHQVFAGGEWIVLSCLRVSWVRFFVALVSWHERYLVVFRLPLLLFLSALPFQLLFLSALP